MESASDDPFVMEAAMFLAIIFAITITALTSLEDCWGLLDYNVEADKGIFYGEREANTQLFNAINDGTLIADMSLVPIELEEASR